jgi:hypothetical protein
MKIIQTLYTWGGERNNCGFATNIEMLAYLSASYQIHKDLADYVIYTDNKALCLQAGIDEADIIEADYGIDAPGRWWNKPKILSQKHHIDNGGGAYMHIDIDACLFSLPVAEAGHDAICEAFRSGFQRQYSKAGLPPARFLPCSGLIGFMDMQLAADYIELALNVIDNWQLPYVDFESLWTAEEVTAYNILPDEAAWLVLEQGTFEHLQGGRK